MAKRPNMRALQMQDAIDRLAKERDRLRDACKAALHRMKTDGYEPQHYGGEVLEMLEAAIAKAEPDRD